MRKTRLELETLSVESFDTTAAARDERGTVHAHEIEPTPPEYPCTCAPSDLCKTAYYYCGTGPHTIHSCDYTLNGSCPATW
ncbi:MAG TPA: hypothetical protein VEX86_19385 [Longimicrobium sp.]|nr:hypothetical protein [Longimicrobium sp.]